MSKYCKVIINDVTLRDGLQSFSRVICHNDRINIGKKIISLGIKNLEVGSIVSKKVIPQMINGIKVHNGMKKFKNYNYSMLISNLKGIDISMKNDVKNIAFFTSPSNTFNLKNINKDVKSSFEIINKLKSNITNGAYTKGYLSCIGECPFEGKLKIDNILGSINEFKNINVDEICLSDTLGTLNSSYLKVILDNLNYEDKNKLSIHLHQKKNDNEWKNIVKLCLDNNINKFDTSLLNLGGCPAAYSSKDKSGNLNLYDLLNYLDDNGYSHDINKNKILEVEKDILTILNKK